MVDPERVFIGLGSNIDPELYLGQAIEVLSRRYETLELSPTYRSTAVGFRGPAFLNLVASFTTIDAPLKIHRDLRMIERDLGRRRSEEKFSSRTIDLDLLLYGMLVSTEESVKIPHDDITRYSFVLRPLVDLAGDQIHPVLDRTFLELFRDLKLDPPRLERIPTPWSGREARGMRHPFSDR